jgi:hypothetical protein
MSRKYTKSARKADAARLSAAAKFVAEWTTTGLASTLIDDYSCTLNCGEADSMAALFRAFGCPSTADGILKDHAEHDECDDSHHKGCDYCKDELPA